MNFDDFNLDKFDAEIASAYLTHWMSRWSECSPIPALGALGGPLRARRHQTRTGDRVRDRGLALALEQPGGVGGLSAVQRQDGGVLSFPIAGTLPRHDLLEQFPAAFDGPRQVLQQLAVAGGRPRPGVRLFDPLCVFRAQAL
jgi:hypothetical protein